MTIAVLLIIAVILPLPCMLALLLLLARPCCCLAALAAIAGRCWFCFQGWSCRCCCGVTCSEDTA
jgi:hypothetical protein